MYDQSAIMGLLAIIWIPIIIAYIFTLSCVSSYATRLGRGSGFVLLGVFFTPFVAFLCLYMVGETDLHRRARIIEEESWKRSFFEEKEAKPQAEERKTNEIN